MTANKAPGFMAETAAFLAGGPVMAFHNRSPYTLSQQSPRQAGRQASRQTGRQAGGPLQVYLVFFLGVVAAPFLVDLLLLPILATASSTPFSDSATPMRPMTTAINITLLKLLTSISMPPAHGCGAHDDRKQELLFIPTRCTPETTVLLRIGA